MMRKLALPFVLAVAAPAFADHHAMAPDAGTAKAAEMKTDAAAAPAAGEMAPAADAGTPAPGKKKSKKAPKATP